MPDTVSIVTGDYPHTRILKSRSSLAGAVPDFIHVSPVHDAFDDMVRTQRYDVCEMAIGAFLQARDAGKPLLLLPVVLVGGFHHGSLYASPAADVRSPRDLAGRRIGVRSYSQTTGLWVRGWLAEEDDLTPDRMTWVVTEGSHSDAYEDPANVVRTGRPLAEALMSGEIDAAILGKSSAPGIAPLVTDHEERDRAWYKRHGFAPVNHMAVTTRAMADKRPDVVRAVYASIAEGIDAREPAAAGSLPPAVRHGLEEVRGAVELAAGYAAAQGLISGPPADIDSLFAFGGRLTGHA